MWESRWKEIHPCSLWWRWIPEERFWGASGDFWENRWKEIHALCGGDEFMLTVMGTICEWWDRENMVSGRSAIFCSSTGPLSLRETTRFQIRLDTVDAPPTIQYPDNPIRLCVILRTWCSTAWRQWAMIKFVTDPFLGRITGCFAACDISACLRRPPMRNRRSSSRNGSSWLSALVLKTALARVCYSVLCDALPGWSDCISSWNSSLWTLDNFSLSLLELLNSDRLSLSVLKHLGTLLSLVRLALL